jgi:hypothetical protein
MGVVTLSSERFGLESRLCRPDAQSHHDSGSWRPDLTGKQTLIGILLRSSIELTPGPPDRQMEV